MVGRANPGQEMIFQNSEWAPLSFFDYFFDSHSLLNFMEDWKEILVFETRSKKRERERLKRWESYTVSKETRKKKVKNHTSTWTSSYPSALQLQSWCYDTERKGRWKVMKSRRRESLSHVSPSFQNQSWVHSLYLPLSLCPKITSGGH